MKKILCIMVSLFVCGMALAASPNLSGYTFTSTRGGETLDFYSDKVVYHAPGMPISRRGDYSFGGTQGLRQPVGGNKSVKINVNVYVGERTVTLSGFVTYNPNNGEPSNLFLNGVYWTK